MLPRWPLASRGDAVSELKLMNVHVHFFRTLSPVVPFYLPRYWKETKSDGFGSAAMAISGGSMMMKNVYVGAAQGRADLTDTLLVQRRRMGRLDRGPALVVQPGTSAAEGWFGNWAAGLDSVSRRSALW